MSNILLTRIDDRLIHGQVVSQWCKELKPNWILVVNDAVAGDETQQELMNMVAPANAVTRYLTVDEAAYTLDKIDDDQKVMILAAGPEDVLKLVEENIPIKKVNIGNMDMKEGKHEVAPDIAVDDKDLDAFRKMAEHGIELEIQKVPGMKSESLDVLK
ncbi:PTS sugar transporter subunit IIB [uncultured Dubosiella sp.]|uniref:PTS sugar transporter subunit IIB n=1 Tax=uncultured Dubosiella sp. TaxID=1937011 RepID=UPI00208AAAF9|nr:PTS sugar transporter subunit IIB [uncultured Dubosiella sp.]GJM58350.1 PTS N-acetylgalactosamine transporter subunit IIB [Erysipelotrichaceae bacterium OPF54]